MNTPAQKLITKDGQVVGVEATNSKTGEKKVIVNAKESYYLLRVASLQIKA